MAKSKWLALPAALAAMSMLTGCALFNKNATTAEKAADVQNLSYAAASIGTSEALAAKPELRPAFDLAYSNLDALVTNKVVDGTSLRAILASLPVKELKSNQARIAIESATVLYDSLTGGKVNIEADAYVLAAATGIRDGMKQALGR